MHGRIHYRIVYTAVYGPHQRPCTAVNKCTLPCTGHTPCTRSCTRITAVQPVYTTVCTPNNNYTTIQQFRLSPEREITQRYSYIS